MTTLDKIDATHFERHLRQPFHVQAGDYAAAWDLIALTPLASPRPGAAAAPDEGSCRSFSMEFRAPAEHRLEQGIYTIRHPEMGALDVFMVPVRADKDGFYLEAVFNRAWE